MHEATCPTCGTRVELDFKPVAGFIWCPKCQKAFSPSGGPVTEPLVKPDDNDGEHGEESDGEV